jgi:hypothetical protein
VRLGLACFAFAILLTAPFGTQLSPWPRSASASTFVELSLAELVSKSTLVVAATPLESTSLWQDGDGRGRRIVTFTKMRVDRVIDGRPPAEVWIRTLGGEVGDIGQHVEGEAVLPVGKPGLLFLRNLTDGTHAVVGMSQGHFPLQLAEGGGPTKLLPPVGMGRLVARADLLGAPNPPARLVLAGRTLDDAAKLIVAERRAHAP